MFDGQCSSTIHPYVSTRATAESMFDMDDDSDGNGDGDDDGDDYVEGRGYEASFAANFHILLPYLTKQAEPEPPEQEEMRKFVRLLSERFQSTHRFAPQMNNLRPFALRNKAVKACKTCKGAGDIKCKYCKGIGFIQMDIEKFDPHYDGWELAPPKKAVGNYYHCPLCGGRCLHRCEDCGGSGIEGAMDRILAGERPDAIENVPKYAAKESFAPATEPFNMEEFLHENKSHIERTDDGLTIVRSQKRKRKPRSKKGKTNTDGSNLEAGCEAESETDAEVQQAPEKSKRKRGRPPKKTIAEATASAKPNENGNSLRRSLSPGSRGVSPTSRRSTDFLNTTDFKVGKRLSIDEEIEQPSEQNTHEQEDG